MKDSSQKLSRQPRAKSCPEASLRVNDEKRRPEALPRAKSPEPRAAFQGSPEPFSGVPSSRPVCVAPPATSHQHRAPLARRSVGCAARARLRGRGARRMARASCRSPDRLVRRATPRAARRRLRAARFPHYAKAGSRESSRADGWQLSSVQPVDDGWRGPYNGSVHAELPGRTRVERRARRSIRRSRKERSARGAHGRVAVTPRGGVPASTGVGIRGMHAELH
jgi:hypothetical protein